MKLRDQLAIVLGQLGRGMKFTGITSPANLSVAFAIVCLSSNMCLAGDLRSEQSLPPGTVLQERWQDIGFGYREVMRSQVTPPGAFEGVSHFSFVYYKEEELCQCDRYNIVISPDGSLLIYTNVADGKLMLFRSEVRKRIILSNEFIGYPMSATWDFSAKKVTVNLTRGSRESIIIPF